jgi:hypothetical protein
MMPVVHVSTRDHVIATWDRVMIILFRVDSTMAAVRSGYEIFDRLAREYPGVFLLTIVEKDARMPSVVVRDAVAEFLSQAAGRMILSAVVYEGTGFRAAAVRSVVSGLAMLTNYSYPHKVFPRVEGAVSWFRTSSPVARSWDEATLLAAIQRVRS